MCDTFPTLTDARSADLKADYFRSGSSAMSQSELARVWGTASLNGPLFHPTVLRPLPGRRPPTLLPF
jgi:hypothetical protein